MAGKAHVKDSEVCMELWIRRNSNNGKYMVVWGHNCTKYEEEGHTETDGGL